MDYKEEIFKAVLSGATKAALDQIIGRLRKKSSNHNFDAELIRSRLELNAAGLLKVKTLLAPENLTPLGKFYCAPRVTGDLSRGRPESVDHFKEDHVLIEGIAGQGKSMLLRMLCANAILNEGKIGVFIELRRAERSKPLATILMEALRDFGLPGNGESLKELSVKKDLIVFLDGFDELDQKNSEKVDRDLHYLVSTYPFVRVFLTSRPHTGMSKSSYLHNCRIEKLDRSDVHRLVRKLCPNDSSSQELIKALDFHKGNALSLLETPLLVTLLVAQYAQTQRLPEQLAEFYDNIFPVLFERHDSFKTPFIRPRRLGLTTHLYRKIFQRFCFASLLSVKLDSETSLRISEWAMKLCDVHGEAGFFLDDIATTSSLINEEAGEWAFIHNSIQEFYAASFLLSCGDEELADYGEKVRNLESGSSVDQVFRFAEEINSVRFLEFLQLPFLKTLVAPIDSNQVINDDQVINWLSARDLVVTWDKNRVNGGAHFTIHMDARDGGVIRLFAPNQSIGAVHAAISLGKRDCVEQLIKVPGVRSRLLSLVSERIEERLVKLNECSEKVKRNREEKKKSEQFLDSLLAN
ncbi:NACHT domain-containing protein [Xanthomonas protegens]|uniref:NACHT domain-containing protein n=1 Tax=Xanthomonas protegens TaxID=3380705 RepID=A0ABU9L7D1_9XANT